MCYSVAVVVCWQKESALNVLFLWKRRENNKKKNLFPFISGSLLYLDATVYGGNESRLRVWGEAGERGDGVSSVMTGLSLCVDKLCGDDGGQRRRLVGQSTRNTLSGDQ